MSVKMDGPIDAFPAEMMWTPAELQSEELRKCTACTKVCNEVFLRVIGMNSVRNYCSKICYDND